MGIRADVSAARGSGAWQTSQSVGPIAKIVLGRLSSQIHLAFTSAGRRVLKTQWAVVF